MWGWGGGGGGGGGGSGVCLAFKADCINPLSPISQIALWNKQLIAFPPPPLPPGKWEPKAPEAAGRYLPTPGAV